LRFPYNYFFRSLRTKKLGEAIALPKLLNKKVLFDIDNLDFEIKYVNPNTNEQELSPCEKKFNNKKFYPNKKNFISL